MIEDARETVEGPSETIEQHSGEASGDGSGALLAPFFIQRGLQLIAQAPEF